MGQYKIIWERCAPDDPAYKAASDWQKQPVSDALNPETQAEQLKAQALEARAPLDAYGHYLAGLFGGAFTLAENKSDESIAHHVELQKLYPQRRYTINKRPDFARGLLLVDSPDQVRQVRHILRAITEDGDHASSLGSIVDIADRYYMPSSSGFAGIFLTVKTPSGHLCEIQVHERNYWNLVQETHRDHKQYQQVRLSGITADWQERREELLAERRSNLLSLLVASNMHTLSAVSDPDGSCSWPLRSHYPKDEEAVHFVARQEPV